MIGPIQLPRESCGYLQSLQQFPRSVHLNKFSGRLVRWLDTSPHGIIEVKCSEEYQDNDPKDILHLSKNPCIQIIDDKVKINVNHSYYNQIQMQLALTTQTWCDFILFTNKGLVIDRVRFDPVRWRDIRDRLTDFYFDYLLPELQQQSTSRQQQSTSCQQQASSSQQQSTSHQQQAASSQQQQSTSRQQQASSNQQQSTSRQQQAASSQQQQSTTSPQQQAASHQQQSASHQQQSASQQQIFCQICNIAMGEKTGGRCLRWNLPEQSDDSDSEDEVDWSNCRRCTRWFHKDCLIRSGLIGPNECFFCD